MSEKEYHIKSISVKHPLCGKYLIDPEDAFGEWGDERCQAVTFEKGDGKQKY